MRYWLFVGCLLSGYPAMAGDFYVEQLPNEFKPLTHQSLTQSVKDYPESISRHLHNFREYPDTTKIPPEEYYVVVFVQMQRDGQIRDVAINRSSGYQALDRAAMLSVKRANPFPSAPEDYLPGAERIAFNIPLLFKPY